MEYCQVLRERDALKQDRAERLDDLFDDIKTRPSDAKKLAVWREMNSAWLEQARHLTRQDKKLIEEAARSVSSIEEAEIVWRKTLAMHIKELGESLHNAIPEELLPHYLHCRSHILELDRKGTTEAYSTDAYTWWFVYNTIYDSWIRPNQEQSEQGGDETPPPTTPPATPPPPPMIFMDAQEKEEPQRPEAKKEPVQTETKVGETAPKAEAVKSANVDDNGGAVTEEMLRAAVANDAEKAKIASETKDAKVLAMLSESNNPKVIEAVVLNVNIGLETAVKLARKKEFPNEELSGRIHAYLVGTCMSEEVNNILADSPRAFVRCAVAKTTKSIELLNKLADDDQPAVRSSVAENPITPANIIDGIANRELKAQREGKENTYPFVLESVVGNPNTSPITLDAIIAQVSGIPEFARVVKQAADARNLKSS